MKITSQLITTRNSFYHPLLNLTGNKHILLQGVRDIINKNPIPVYVPRNENVLIQTRERENTRLINVREPVNISQI